MYLLEGLEQSSIDSALAKYLSTHLLDTTNSHFGLSKIWDHTIEKIGTGHPHPIFMKMVFWIPHFIILAKTLGIEKLKCSGMRYKKIQIALVCGPKTEMMRYPPPTPKWGKLEKALNLC